MKIITLLAILFIAHSCTTSIIAPKPAKTWLQVTYYSDSECKQETYGFVESDGCTSEVTGLCSPKSDSTGSSLSICITPTTIEDFVGKEPYTINAYYNAGQCGSEDQLPTSYYYYAGHCMSDSILRCVNGQPYIFSYLSDDSSECAGDYNYINILPSECINDTTYQTQWQCWNQPDTPVKPGNYGYYTYADDDCQVLTGGVVFFDAPCVNDTSCQSNGYNTFSSFRPLCSQADNVEDILTNELGEDVQAVVATTFVYGEACAENELESVQWFLTGVCNNESSTYISYGCSEDGVASSIEFSGSDCSGDVESQNVYPTTCAYGDMLYSCWLKPKNTTGLSGGVQTFSDLNCQDLVSTSVTLGSTCSALSGTCYSNGFSSQKYICTTEDTADAFITDASTVLYTDYNATDCLTTEECCQESQVTGFYVLTDDCLNYGEESSGQYACVDGEPVEFVYFGGNCTGTNYTRVLDVNCNNGMSQYSCVNKAYSKEGASLVEYFSDSHCNNYEYTYFDLVASCDSTQSGSACVTLPGRGSIKYNCKSGLIGSQ